MYYYMADDFDDHMPDVQYSLNEFVRFAKEYTEAQPKINLKSAWKKQKYNKLIKKI